MKLISTIEELLEGVQNQETEFVLTADLPSFTNIPFIQNRIYQFSSKTTQQTIQMDGYSPAEGVILSFTNIHLKATDVVFVIEHPNVVLTINSCTITSKWIIDCMVNSGRVSIINTTMNATEPFLKIPKNGTYVSNGVCMVNFINTRMPEIVAYSEVIRVNGGIYGPRSIFVLQKNGEMLPAANIKFVLPIESESEWNEFMRLVTKCRFGTDIEVSIDPSLTEVKDFVFRSEENNGKIIHITIPGTMTVKEALVRNHLLEITGNVTVTDIVVVDKWSKVTINGTFTGPSGAIPSPINNYDSRIVDTPIGTPGGDQGGEMTNKVLQKYIDTFGERIFEIMFDNSFAVFIGYPSSKVNSVKDIILSNVEGTDMVGFRQISPHQPEREKGVTFVTWHLTSCIQWIGVMDEPYKDLRIDPLVLK